MKDIFVSFLSKPNKENKVTSIDFSNFFYLTIHIQKGVIKSNNHRILFHLKFL